MISAVEGPLATAISGPAPLENAPAGSFVYVLSERQAAPALASQASLVVAPAKLQGQVKPPAQQTWFFSRNPELTMAMIKNHFFGQTPYRAPQTEKIHPRAFVDSSAELHASVIVGPGAAIGARVKIGANSFVGANAVIEPGTVIGENSTIHPLAYIGAHCVIGNRCEVQPQACVGAEGYGYAHDEKGNHYRIAHTGRVVLEDDVHIGAATCIDRGTIGDSVIGRGTKIDNLVHLAHNSVVGKNGLLTAQFAMAGSSKIGDNFISGGRASVTGHVTITDGVQIAGLAGVTNDIDKPGQYGGYPLESLQDFLKTKAALVNLKEMRKQLRELLKAKS